MEINHLVIRTSKVNFHATHELVKISVGYVVFFNIVTVRDLEKKFLGLSVLYHKAIISVTAITQTVAGTMLMGFIYCRYCI